MDRTGFIGSSEISAVMGKSKWMTPLKLWCIKTGKIKADDLSEVEAVEWGTRLEEVVAKKFADKHKVKLMAYKTRFVHPDYPYMSCELDRIITGTDEMVEVKTCNSWAFKDWQGEDMPIEYILQINFALGLSKRKVGWVAVLVGGQKYLEKKVEFDQELFDIQVESAKQFWNNFVLLDIPPMSQEGDKDTLYNMYPQSKDTGIVFEGTEEEEIESLLQDRSGAIESINHCEEEIEKIENKIKEKMKDSEFAETRGYRITWKTQNGSRVDLDKMREAGIYENFLKPTTCRKFSAKERKLKK